MGHHLVYQESKSVDFQKGQGDRLENGSKANRQVRQNGKIINVYAGSYAKMVKMVHRKAS